MLPLMLPLEPRSGHPLDPTTRSYVMTRLIAHCLCSLFCAAEDKGRLVNRRSAKGQYAITAETPRRSDVVE